jgi:hypothetical protein
MKGIAGSVLLPDNSVGFVMPRNLKGVVTTVSDALSSDHVCTERSLMGYGTGCSGLERLCFYFGGEEFRWERWWIE